MTDNLDDLRKLDLPFDVDDVIPQCHECIRKQLEKYKNAYDENNMPVRGRFIVPCKGILKNIIDDETKKALTDKQIEELTAIKDVVSFAKKYIKLPNGEPFEARWYQEAILRCSSKRVVLRCSRRIGKCLSKHSKLFTNIGLLTSEEVISRQKNKESILLASFDVENNEIKFTDTFNIWSNGIKDTYKIVTASGRETFVTSNHPFLVFCENGELEWKELKDLSEGEHIAVPSSYENLPFGKDIGNRYSRLLGYLTGDGSTNHSHFVGFTNFDQDIIDDFTDIINDYNCELSHVEEGNFRVISKDKDRHKKYRNNVNALVTKAGIRSLAKHKTVPKEIFSASKENIANFLGAYWDCDGWCSVGSKTHDEYHSLPSIQIGCTSASKELITDIYHLLLRLGICGRMRFKLAKCDGKTFDAWTLDINNADSILKFAENIPLRAKKQNLQKVIDIAKQKVNDLKGPLQYIPAKINNYIYNKCKEKDLSTSYIFNKNYIKTKSRNSLTGNVIKRKLANAADTLEDIYLKGLCNSPILWDKIKSIELIGEEETYDVNVPETNTLIADDIISHNTTLVCIQILYNLFTRKNLRILVIGPQKKHAEEIFNRVKDFIYSNPVLAKSIKRDVLSPYAKIELKNGSLMEGFAGGADSGNKKGVGIRGSDADMIYLEEADYIDEESIRGAGLPILMTTPDVTVTAFSTPSGFKTLYYKWCVEDPHYIEFYHDYKVLDWYKNIEAERSSFTEEKWNHEMLALFSDSASGVYKKSYVDRALYVYKYEDTHRMANWVYCMGVDWNEEHGTELVVLGQNKFTNTFRVVDVQHVPKSEFTQLSGIAKLIELNKKWLPRFIYIDRGGGGSTNYEVLMQEAMRQYDSGASIEVKDIYTNDKRKEPAKPFMVNASIRMFEQGLIHISAADKILEAQLRNYIIERTTPSKVPVYGRADEKIEDHRLDALNLAIVAFHLEFDDLYKTQVVTEVAALLDPRTVKREGNKITKVVSRPEARRIEGDFELNWVEKHFFKPVPGRIDGPSRQIKTTRPGWDVDREEIERAKWTQRRKRKLGRGFRDPPKRENI